jgi:hypothetical protein
VTSLRAGLRWALPDPFADDLRDADRMLDELGLGRRFTLCELHCAVAARASRPVRIVAWPAPMGGITALRVSGPTSEYVFYDGTAPMTLRVLCIGHEIAHIIYDDPVTTSAADLAAILREAPPLPGRFATRVEQRAEMFGTAVIARIANVYDCPLWTAGEPIGLDELLTLLGGQHDRNPG